MKKKYYIDPENGLDTNIGSRRKPLKTFKEALKRLGGTINPILKQKTDIIIK
jgi:hypothetical protein